MKLRPRSKAVVAPPTTTRPMRNTASRLLAVLSQHEMLTTLCENLSSADIVHLGATCKEAKTYVLDSPTIFQQLKGDAICDGRGIIARRRVFGHWDGFARACLQGFERPCSDCGAMVCDECRFHVDYTSVQAPGMNAEQIEALIEEEREMTEMILDVGHEDYINDTKELVTLIEGVKACDVWRKRIKRFCKTHHPLSLTDFERQHPCCGAAGLPQSEEGFFEHFAGNRWLCLPCFFLEEVKSVEEDRLQVLRCERVHEKYYYVRLEVCECGQLAHPQSIRACKYCGHHISYSRSFEQDVILPAILQQLGHEEKEEGELARIYAQLG